MAVVVGGGLAAGVWRGHVVFAVVLAIAIVAAWRLGGFGPVAAVCVGAIALGSSGYPGLRDLALDERWVALGTLAAWPVVSGRRPEIPASRLLLGAIGALLALAALSTLWSVDQHLTVQRGGTFALVLWAGLVAVPTHARTARERENLARSLAGLVLVGCVAAVVVRLVDPPAGNQSGAINALRGWFENSNELGIWSAALAPCLLLVRPRRVAVAAAVLVGAVIVFSASRSALFAAGVLAVALLPIPVSRRLAIGGALIVVVAAIAATPARDLLPGTIFQKYGDTSAGLARTFTGARNEGWEATFDEVGKRPAHGYGFGTGDRVFALTRADQKFRYFTGSSPNNGYLQMLLELGIPGLLLLGLTLFAAVRAGWRRRGDPTCTPFLLMGSILLVVAIAESDLTSAGGPFAILVWTGLGVAMGTTPVERLPSWATAPAAWSRRRRRVGIGIATLAGLGLVAVAPVPRLHWLYREAVRSNADGPDPLFSAPVDGPAMRHAGALLPDDATYYIHASQSDAPLRYNLTGAARLFFTPAVGVQVAERAQWVLSYRAPDLLPPGLRAGRSVRLGDRIYLIRVRAR